MISVAILSWVRKIPPSNTHINHRFLNLLLCHTGVIAPFQSLVFPGFRQHDLPPLLIAWPADLILEYTPLGIDPRFGR
jgi:hypothetical protein